jgi:hypothetical protein
MTRTDNDTTGVVLIDVQIIDSVIGSMADLLKDFTVSASGGAILRYFVTFMALGSILSLVIAWNHSRTPEKGTKKAYRWINSYLKCSTLLDRQSNRNK